MISPNGNSIDCNIQIHLEYYSVAYINIYMNDLLCMNKTDTELLPRLILYRVH